MKDCSRWSRREFVQMAGSLAAMNFGSPLLAAIGAADGTAAAKFAYVGFGGKGAKGGGIAVFDLRGAGLRGGGWEKGGMGAGARPSAVSLQGTRRVVVA